MTAELYMVKLGEIKINSDSKTNEEYLKVSLIARGNSTDRTQTMHAHGDGQGDRAL